MILLLNLHFKLVLVCLDEGSNTVIRCRSRGVCDGMFPLPPDLMGLVSLASRLRSKTPSITSSDRWWGR